MPDPVRRNLGVTNSSEDFPCVSDDRLVAGGLPSCCPNNSSVSWGASPISLDSLKGRITMLPAEEVCRGLTGKWSEELSRLNERLRRAMGSVVLTSGTAAGEERFNHTLRL